LLKAEGKSFFLAMAKAMRETPKIEVSKTLAVASIPPSETTYTRIGLPTVLIASVRGEIDFPRLSAPISPTATEPTKMYMIVDIANARIMDRGITLLASLTSSATTATLAKPP